jgi:predicted chitinase
MSEESKRALVATILVETGNLFAPIKELGSDDYLLQHYWYTKSVREMLGNVLLQDALDYCGKGFIQITGRNNYERCACALNLPLMHQPDLLLQPEPSARAAIWFWNINGIPALVDAVRKHTDAPNRDRVWTQVRRKVNGGVLGIEAFLANLRALEIR